MFSKEFAADFAQEWIAAWNIHNLEKVLEHYAEEFTMSSPFIVKLAQEPSCKLQGKVAVGNYWSKALALYPNLQFELISTLVGVNRIMLYYKGVSGPAAEVFYFDEKYKVIRAEAHYAQ